MATLMHDTAHEQRAISSRVEAISRGLARYGLVVVVGWIGLMKFTRYEAEGIRPFVANSPLMPGRWMATRFNRPEFEDLINFNVYALCGDGRMMEGISAEAASLAGHLKLSNLCWVYDNNHITIEGNTALAFPACCLRGRLPG